MKQAKTLKVIVLGSGTSQGVPVIACACEVCQSLDYRDQRLRVSVYVETEGKCFVIDTGPDFRQQMLRENIQHLDAVLYTHEHKDHTAGMDDLRSFNFKLQKDVPIYARESVMQQLKREFAYIFTSKENKYPGVLNVEEHLLENKPFEIEGVQIIPIEVLHFKLPVFGFRIKDFTYITDVNYVSPEEKEKIKGTRFLVLDALQRENHVSHFTLEQAVDFVNSLDPLPEKTYLTHISHRMGLHAEVAKELPPHIEPAYDGLVIEY